jgi:hypothetical protein
LLLWGSLGAKPITANPHGTGSADHSSQSSASLGDAHRGLEDGHLIEGEADQAQDAEDAAYGYTVSVLIAGAE